MRSAKGGSDYRELSAPPVTRHSPLATRQGRLPRPRGDYHPRGLGCIRPPCRTHLAAPADDVDQRIVSLSLLPRRDCAPVRAMSLAANGRNPHARLRELVAQAGDRARSLGRRVLVSVAEQVATIDPLEALAGLERCARVDDILSEHLAAGRMFWSRPREGFAIAGLGAAMMIAPEGPDRFAEIDAEWTALRDGACVEDPSRGATGVGPVLLGGAAFEPRTPR